MARKGRPKKEINQDKFEQMCALQMTGEDIAFFFDCDADTVNSWCKRTYKKTFSEVFKQKRMLGKLSHRAAQFAMAKNNPTMSIWLGKQYFGQSDSQELIHRGAVPVTIIDDVGKGGDEVGKADA